MLSGARSLIVFLVVSLGVSWLTRNAGMGTAAHFILSFASGFVAAWLFERFTAKKPPS